MNGIEKITAQIQSDMQQEIDALLAKGTAQAAAIRADYQARAQEAYAQGVAKGQQAAAERLDR